MRNYLLRKFRFLSELGYTVSEEGSETTYKCYYFEKDGIRVSVTYDYRWEYVNIRVKKGTEVLLETCGSCVVINSISWKATDFLTSVKEIYSRRRGLSLTKAQMLQLIDMYAGYLYEVWMRSH